jgi:hypothetical protein
MNSRFLGVVISFLVLALGIMSLRCYVRLRIKRCFGLDDSLSVAALVNRSTSERCCTYPRMTPVADALLIMPSV